MLWKWTRLHGTPLTKLKADKLNSPARADISLSTFLPFVSVSIQNTCYQVTVIIHTRDLTLRHCDSMYGTGIEAGVRAGTETKLLPD